MNTIKNARTWLVGMSLSVLAALPAAHAQNNYTNAGVSVEGTFTLNYSVGGTSQPQIDNTASPTTFTVDRLVDITVSYSSASDDSTVAPGAQNEELVFLLRNDGNDNFAYFLSTENGTGDDFNTDNLEIRYYVDDGDGTYEPGADDGSPTTFASVTSDVAPDAILWVEVIGDIPASQPDSETSDVVLVADTYYPTVWLEAAEGSPGSPGTNIGADDGTNDMNSVAENVLNDAAGDGSSDAANDGKHSDTGTFTVSSPDLTAAKTVEVISTNADGTFVCASGALVSANEYAIPGSCLEYTITIVNSGSAAATVSSISDTLPTEFTFNGATFTNFTGGTEATPTAGDDCSSVACTVSQTGATIGAGVTATIEIRVTVN